MVQLVKFFLIGLLISTAIMAAFGAVLYVAGAFP
jgi:hypothetical protein